MTVTEAARQLGVAPSTLPAGCRTASSLASSSRQARPGRSASPTRLRARFTEDAPPGWLPMRAAMKALGVSRQTVLQRVKRGQLRAVHVHRGRQPGLRIEVPRKSAAWLTSSPRSRAPWNLCDDGSRTAGRGPPPRSSRSRRAAARLQRLVGAAGGTRSSRGRRSDRRPVSTCRIACWMNRSTTVGIPPPLPRFARRLPIRDGGHPHHPLRGRRVEVVHVRRAPVRI